MTLSSPLTWGIVGCGRVSRNHAWAAREAGLDLRWACDSRPDRADRLAQEFGIQLTTADVSELLSDAALDIVVIATGHASHLPLARRALGKSGVLIEKPLGVPADNYRAFVSEAEESSSVVGVVSQHRTNPVTQAVRAALERGEYGTVQLVRCTTLAHRDDEYYVSSDWRGRALCEGGSALINQGYHGLDVLVYLFGRPRVLAARVWSSRPQVIEVDEGYAGRLRFPGGVEAQVCGTNGPSTTWDVVVEIYGSAGYVVFDLNSPPRIRSSVPPLHVEAVTAAPPSGVSYYGAGHLGILQDFVRAVRTGGSPAVTPAESANTLDVIARFYRRAGGISRRDPRP